jgi:ubiquinone/menaquinone biosynthesis C-methylase UbiE
MAARAGARPADAVKSCPVCGSGGGRRERTLNGIDLVRCGRCALVYAALPDAAIEVENRAIFDSAAADVYEARQTALDVAWFERIAARLTRGAGCGSVLDVGCGNGWLLAAFQKRGWSAEGVDFSSWAEPFARRHGYTLHQTTLEGAGLPENRFDVVTSTSTLEHIARPCEHMREILRVLKPGGTAYVAGVPNYGSLAVRLGLSAFAHNLPPRHVNYFTRASLQNLLAIPGIRERVGRARVSSYGVPEVHGLLERLGRSLRSRPAPGRPERPARKRSTWPHVLRRAVVEANYRLGRFLDLGDKLEMEVVKRD